MPVRSFLIMDSSSGGATGPVTINQIQTAPNRPICRWIIFSRISRSSKASSSKPPNQTPLTRKAVAPPVYRPQPLPLVLQPKTHLKSGTAQLKTENQRQALQMNLPASSQPTNQTKPAPVAPAVYHPQAS